MPDPDLDPGGDHPLDPAIDAPATRTRRDRGRGFLGNSRFEVLGYLGEGAYGVVYQAFDRARQSQVALKVLRQLHPDAIYYFKNEFRALRDIRHPNLVELRELLVDDGHWFLTMELIRGTGLVEYVRPGESIGSLLSAPGPSYEEQRVRRCLIALAGALDHIHAHGKIHRDVKPSNILTTTAGSPVLLDFGFVLEQNSPHLTQRSRVGTEAYMAPEQAFGEGVGPEADWYALGAVLFDCLTGRPPFVGPALDILLQKKKRQVPRPGDIVSGIPEDLERICLGLLERRPENRAEAIAELRDLRENMPTPSRRSRPPGPRAASDFVGRGRELSSLYRLLDACCDRKLSVACVHGDSGFGKTRLIEEFLARVQRERSEVVILQGRCHERETLPYKGFDGLIDELVCYLRRLADEELVALLPRDIALLSSFFTAFGRVDAIQLAPSVGRAELPRNLERRRAFMALRELFARLADRAPVVMVVDDLQWADQDSLDLLESLLLGDSLFPVLFILSGTTSPDGPSRVARVLASGLGAADVSASLCLRELAAREARRFASALLVDSAGHDRYVDWVASESGGHPLFIEMLARHCEHSAGDLARPSLDEAIREGLEQLEDDALQLLRALSVAGSAMSPGFLHAVSGVDMERVEILIPRLELDRWVRCGKTSGERTVEMGHARLRFAVEQGLAESERTALHVTMAQQLGVGGESSERAVAHWVDAGRSSEALAVALDVAAMACRSRDFDRAVRLYRRAIELCDQSQLSTIRELEEKLAEVLLVSGVAVEAATLLDRLANSASRDPLRLRVRSACTWFDAGYVERGVAAARPDWGQLGGMPAMRRRDRGPRQLVRWLSAVWMSPPRLGERPGAPERDRLAALRLRLLWSMAAAHCMRDMNVARSLQRVGLLEARALGEPRQLALFMAREVWWRAFRPGGGRAAVESWLDELHAFAERSDDAQVRAHVHLLEGALLHDEGHYAQSRDACAAAVGVVETSNLSSHFVRTAARHQEEQSLLIRGAWAELQSLLSYWLRFAERRGLRTVQLRHNLYSAYWLCLVRDVPDEARACLELKFAEPADRASAAVQADSVAAKVDIDLYVGDPNAHARVARAWPDLVRAGMLLSPVHRRRLWWTRGRAALGASVLLPAERGALLRVARRAMRELRHEGSCTEGVFADILKAGLARLMGEPERAVTLYGMAAVLCEQREMVHLAAATRHRQGALLGTREGARMVEQSEQRLHELGAAQPGRIVVVLLGH